MWLLALAVGAAGVHLGREDGSIAAARARLGADAIIGATCHARLDFARQALDEGLARGVRALFPSATKPQAQGAPLSLIAEAEAQRHLWW